MLHIVLILLCLLHNINVQMVKNPTVRFSVQLFHYNHVVSPFLSGLFHQFRRSLIRKLPTLVERKLIIMLLPARLVVFVFVYLLISHSFYLYLPLFSNSEKNFRSVSDLLVLKRPPDDRKSGSPVLLVFVTLVTKD